MKNVLCSLLLVTGTIEPAPEPAWDQVRLFSHQLSECALNYGTAALLGSASVLARIGWAAWSLTPWASTWGQDLLLVSEILGSSASHLFSHNPFHETYPVCQAYTSWYENQAHLSNIPANSLEDQKLLHFLEKRWLAKSTGYYPTAVNRVCPCFGIRIQVHPETTSSYARDPSNKISQTYAIRIDDWKAHLPHPHHFPLILTRPASINPFLPHLTSLDTAANIQTALIRDQHTILDLTPLFSDPPETWEHTWEDLDAQISSHCLQEKISAENVLCIQQLEQEQLGGVRLLPLSSLSADQIEAQHQFLLFWISKLGLTANRVELDRWSTDSLPEPQPRTGEIPPCTSKEMFLHLIEEYERRWHSSFSEKNLLHNGTMSVLKGLLQQIDLKQWETTLAHPTRGAVVLLSLSKIEKELELLDKQEQNAPFYLTASHLEQIHAALTPLLEVFSPYTTADFPKIFQHCLHTSWLPHLSFGLHSSGMTSLAGIFHAVQTQIGKRPRVLYGENAYFENIYASEHLSHASPLEEATEVDCEEADLILAQFNPILRRIDYAVTDYKVEPIEEQIRYIFTYRSERPLTLAVDCTLDYIDSPRMQSLLNAFAHEILSGKLNVISYRSGLKFDLFGMDNYCGAPFYMVHNAAPHWDCFASLCDDPLLTTDLLSTNWFCLAYQHAAPDLEAYRRQVFQNTRTLLDRVPKRLFARNTRYRIVPIDPQADAGFLDIKIYGPLHQLRSSLVGGFLTLKAMENAHPLFYRPSIGFYHPNLSILYSEECSTIRLTLGLDPSQVDLFVACFEQIDRLNGN